MRGENVDFEVDGDAALGIVRGGSAGVATGTRGGVDGGTKLRWGIGMIGGK